MTALGLNLAMSGGGSGLLAPTIPVALDFQNKRFWLGSASTKVLTELAGFTYSRPGYNLIPYSTDPSNGTAWGTGNATKTAGLPDRFGGNTAARITADGLSASHYGGAGFNFTVFTSGVTYNLALDFFAETQSLVQITGTGGVFGTAQYANFNLATGVLTASAGVVGTPQIENLGAGWYRASVSLLATASSAAATGLIAGAITSPTAGRLELNTLATSFLIARPQVEPGTVANAYQPTTATALTYAPISTAEGLVDDVATNKVAVYNANPTSTLGLFVSSGTGTIGRVDDAAAIAAVPEIASKATSGMVFRIDNTGQATVAQVTISGEVGNLYQHVAAAWVRGGSGIIGGSTSADGVTTFPASAGYVRRSASFTPTATARTFSIRADPGQIVYFILPGLYERPTVPAVDVVTLGAAASGVVGQVGGIISFPANTPRLTSRGLLEEDQGQNLFMSAGDMRTGTNWNVFGTITDAGDHPSAPFRRVRVASGGFDWHRTSSTGPNTGSVVSGTAYSVVCYYEAGTSGKFRVDIRNYVASVGSVVTGTIGGTLSVQDSNAGPITNISTRQIGNGIYRTSFVWTPNFTGSTQGSGIGPFTATSGQDIVALGIQIAPGTNTEASFIPTGPIALTRAADPSWITGLGAYLAAPFTLSVEVDLPAIDGTDRKLVATDNGAITDGVQMSRTTGNAARVRSDVGGAGTFLDVGGKSGARIIKSAMRVRPGGFTGAVDGALTATSLVAPPSGINTLFLGSRRGSTSDHLNGYIRRIQIARNTSDAQLKRFTTTGYAIPEPPENSSLLRLLLLGF